MQDPRINEFLVPANVLTLSPIAGVPVFVFQATRCTECRVCLSVWEGDPPGGHVCYPPIDPRLAWPA